jgi:hypothetical protein
MQISQIPFLRIVHEIIKKSIKAKEELGKQEMTEKVLVAPMMPILFASLALSFLAATQVSSPLKKYNHFKMTSLWDRLYSQM